MQVSGSDLTVAMKGRGYFADTCDAGVYANNNYLALQLLGRRMRYSVDLSGVGCGCNAAMYLVSMKQNTDPCSGGDYYCDANVVCGVACAEIDIQEANMHAWHSTLHAASDKDGVAAGLGGGGWSWNGPRDWSTTDYGQGGRCVDTNAPFDVSVSFHATSDQLASMQVELSQAGKPCTLSTKIDGYASMQEMTQALKDGMTPVVSYWANEDMLWMDGQGSDGQGACSGVEGAQCKEQVTFSNFRVEEIPWEEPVPSFAPMPAPFERDIVIRLDPGANMPGISEGGEIDVVFQGQTVHAHVVSLEGGQQAAGHGGNMAAAARVLGLSLLLLGGVFAFLAMSASGVDVKAAALALAIRAWTALWEAVPVVKANFLAAAARLTASRQPAPASPQRTSWLGRLGIYPGEGSRATDVEADVAAVPVPLPEWFRSLQRQLMRSEPSAEQQPQPAPPAPRERTGSGFMMDAAAFFTADRSPSPSQRELLSDEVP